MANPFIAATENNASAAADNLPYLQEYAWDFEHNRFRLDENGKNIIVYENEALKVWIYKCLKCERFLYNAYRHGEFNDRCNYGIVLEKYIGKNPNNEKTASLIRKEIKDAVSANPYIKTVDYVDIAEIRHDQLKLNMGVTSIYGETRITMTI